VKAEAQIERRIREVQTRQIRIDEVRIDDPFLDEELSGPVA
jgi:hypothetical protein